VTRSAADCPHCHPENFPRPGDARPESEDRVAEVIKYLDAEEAGYDGGVWVSSRMIRGLLTDGNR
jgi:hypothetical protein